MSCFLRDWQMVGTEVEDSVNYETRPYCWIWCNPDRMSSKEISIVSRGVWRNNLLVVWDNVSFFGVYIWIFGVAPLSYTKLTLMLIEGRRVVKKNCHFVCEGVKLCVSFSERDVVLGSYLWQDYRLACYTRAGKLGRGRRLLDTKKFHSPWCYVITFR